MKMFIYAYCFILVASFNSTSCFAAPCGTNLTEYRLENSDKKTFESFEVSIVTGHDKDGLSKPPYLIVTEQRFIEGQKVIEASLSSETLRVLNSGLLVSTTYDIHVGNHKVTVVRKIYEFKPPAKRYTLHPRNFDKLKDSHPFRELIIDTDGKGIHGEAIPPQI